MEKVAIYTRYIADDFKHHLVDFFDILHERNVELMVYEPSLPVFYKVLKDHIPYSTFNSHLDLRDEASFLVSIGGDGTLLDSTLLIRDSGIPIVGINTGRLGFLARISLDELGNAVDELLNGNFEEEERTLLKLESDSNLFPNKNFALNELTIHKKDSTSMVKIHTYVNGEFLNTYWADGLIISTPTGSTAYSLSCGGPIVYPGSNNFVITPVAPHNLNVRPIVLPDDCKLSFRVEGRSEQFLASLDSRTEVIDASTQLSVVKNDFSIKLLRLHDYSFLKTIRNKMNWGLDIRN
ncbi:MAG: NAD kinase [Crocinitomicaceae bacterium]|nr:NAD kinase [Crocinitomicaceae bacterium]|tara:strand:- start:4153 stop:5034 length:882 start_codon:yes stop_codon:yes gene_type:complete